ncbi:hypothetical protein [Azospirillum palustre]
MRPGAVALPAPNGPARRTATPAPRSCHVPALEKDGPKKNNRHSARRPLPRGRLFPWPGCNGRQSVIK